MLVGNCAAVAAVFLIGTSVGWADCLPGQSRNCANLTFAPSPVLQSTEKNDETPWKPDNQPKAYTGPIVGLSPTVKPTPTIGYRWSI